MRIGIGIGIEIAILLTRIDRLCSIRIGIESNSIPELKNRTEFDSGRESESCATLDVLRSCLLVSSSC